VELPADIRAHEHGGGDGVYGSGPRATWIRGSPTNPYDVEYAIATRVSSDRDIMIITGIRRSSLDPCRTEDGITVKVGIDATMVPGREDEFRCAT
jgi:3-polyprenyl-4-hydroxybenzoate decarboxylase